MTQDDRIFIPPTLCDCRLNIVAKWVKPLAESDELGRKVSYHHPIPFTINSIQIVAVCAEHEHFKTDPPITDITYGGEMSGYFQNPVTEAEKLYVALTRYAGQRTKFDTCDCKVYSNFDRTTKTHEYKAHVKHTQKCSAHQNDDNQHSNARENNVRKNLVHTRLKENVITNLTEEEFGWSYDANRVLHINIGRLTNPQKTALRAWCDTNLGVGKVVID